MNSEGGRIYRVAVGEGGLITGGLLCTDSIMYLPKDTGKVEQTKLSLKQQY